MPEVFVIGQRVRVRQDPEFGPGPWPAEPMAVVTGYAGDVDTRRGPQAMYWVRFDEPQFDADGDGPYRYSQVLAPYLEAIE